MYRRRSRATRYPRRIKTVKYSNETYNFSGTFNAGAGDTNPSVNVAVISSISQQGTRKVKNLELSMSTDGPFKSADGTSTNSVPIFWALVYVPEGTTPSTFSFGSPQAPASLYEPNQNVIMSGVWPADLTSPYRVKSRLARNLNSGDSIYLIFGSPFTPAVDMSKEIACAVNYAISF